MLSLEEVDASEAVGMQHFPWLLLPAGREIPFEAEQRPATTNLDRAQRDTLFCLPVL